jgi:hypothetical protein
MVRKNSNEWKLRKLLEQNSNGGLKIETIIEELTPLINKPRWSGEYCVICKWYKENGWSDKIKKTIHNSPVCQSHMRCAVVIKQNPYDDSFEKNFRRILYEQ